MIQNFRSMVKVFLVYLGEQSRYNKWKDILSVGAQIVKKTLLGLSAMAVAVALTGFMMQSGTGRVKAWADQLRKADGISVKMTSQIVGGGRSNYAFDFAQPNKARIDTPTLTVYSDGATITTYFKTQQQFLKQPYSAEKLSEFFNSDEMAMFRPFIDEKAFNGFSSLSSKGTMSRRGSELETIKFNMGGGRSATAYFSTADNVLRQMEIVTQASGMSQSQLVDMSSVTFGRPSDAVFTFNPPAGSKEVTEAELNAFKWYDNVPDALADAKRTNRMVMLDFYFVGCHWCDMLDNTVYTTEEFRTRAKNFVLCKVDIITHPERSDPYGVSGVPDVRFLTMDGKEVHKISGYVPADKFCAEMDKAISMK